MKVIIAQYWIYTRITEIKTFMCCIKRGGWVIKWIDFDLDTYFLKH